MKTFLYPVLGLVLAGAGCNRTPSSVDAAGLPGAVPAPEPRLGYAEVAGNSAAAPALAKSARGYRPKFRQALSSMSGCSTRSIQNGTGPGIGSRRRSMSLWSRATA